MHWSGGGEPRLLLVGHHDTVFPAGTIDQRPFAVSDGRVTGPGVFDMKAGLVQAIHALAALPDRSGIEVLVNSDEEIGSTTSRALIEARAAACGAVFVLEPSADGGALKTGRKGTGTFDVRVHGRAAHAGLEPEKGINALVAAAELIGRIATFGDPPRDDGHADRRRGGHRRQRRSRRGPLQRRRARRRRRGRRSGSRRRWPRWPRRCPALSSRSAAASAAADARVGLGTLFPLAVQAAERIGQPAPAGIAVGGGSDGNFTAAIGVPTLDGLGAVGGGAHADHEHVLVDTLVPRAELLAALISLAVAAPRGSRSDP